MNIREQGVIRSESGIIKKNGIFFHTASAFAQQYLFYGLWGAEYICRSPYHVKRKHLDAFLLFFIKSGELSFCYRDTCFCAKAGDVVLLDCNFPHEYYAQQEVHFCWFHFHGNASQAYCDLLWKNNNAHFPSQQQLETDFSAILQMLASDCNMDDQISVAIHRLLSLLNTQGHTSKTISSSIQHAKYWIEQHFREDITIDQAAEQASLSRFYFSRRFHEEVGLSPHEYLLNLRISYAKQQLSESSDSIEQIAFNCAFCSASNLIRAFKKSTGITPYQFRKIISSTI